MKRQRGRQPSARMVAAPPASARLAPRHAAAPAPRPCLPFPSLPWPPGGLGWGAPHPYSFAIHHALRCHYRRTGGAAPPAITTTIITIAHISVPPGPGSHCVLTFFLLPSQHTSTGHCSSSSSSGSVRTTSTRGNRLALIVVPHRRPLGGTR